VKGLALGRSRLRPSGSDASFTPQDARLGSEKAKRRSTFLDLSAPNFDAQYFRSSLAQKKFTARRISSPAGPEPLRAARRGRAQRRSAHRRRSGRRSPDMGALSATIDAHATKTRDKHSDARQGHRRERSNLTGRRTADRPGRRFFAFTGSSGERPAWNPRGSMGSMGRDKGGSRRACHNFRRPRSSTPRRQRQGGDRRRAQRHTFPISPPR